MSDEKYLVSVLVAKEEFDEIEVSAKSEEDAKEKALEEMHLRPIPSGAQTTFLEVLRVSKIDDDNEC